MPPAGSSIVFKQSAVQKGANNVSIDWSAGTNGENPADCDAKVDNISGDGTTVTIQF